MLSSDLHVRSIFKTLVLLICFYCGGLVVCFGKDYLFLSRFVKIGPMSLGDINNEVLLVILIVSLCFIQISNSARFVVVF